VVYEELHRVAENAFRGEAPGHTLQPTALVNEAWARLFAGRQPDWQDRGHFLRTAARAMRRILVDHARAKLQIKGGERRVVPCASMDQLMTVFEERSIDVLALHEAIERLKTFDERAAEIVELRFFVGYSMAEVAEAMELSTATVERKWRLTRSWLNRELA